MFFASPLLWRVLVSRSQSRSLACSQSRSLRHRVWCAMLFLAWLCGLWRLVLCDISLSQVVTHEAGWV
jgi:hypothetical protein